MPNWFRSPDLAKWKGGKASIVWDGGAGSTHSQQASKKLAVECGHTLNSAATICSPYYHIRAMCHEPHESHNPEQSDTLLLGGSWPQPDSKQARRADFCSSFALLGLPGVRKCNCPATQLSYFPAQFTTRRAPLSFLSRLSWAPREAAHLSALGVRRR
jgi:hypothetical protein